MSRGDPLAVCQIRGWPIVSLRQRRDWARGVSVALNCRIAQVRDGNRQAAGEAAIYLLFVCTAGRCRSPMAAALLKKRLGELLWSIRQLWGAQVHGRANAADRRVADGSARCRPVRTHRCASDRARSCGSRHRPRYDPRAPAGGRGDLGPRRGPRRSRSRTSCAGPSALAHVIDTNEWSTGSKASAQSVSLTRPLVPIQRTTWPIRSGGACGYGGESSVRWTDW